MKVTLENIYLTFKRQKFEFLCNTANPTERRKCGDPTEQRKQHGESYRTAKGKRRILQNGENKAANPTNGESKTANLSPKFLGFFLEDLHGVGFGSYDRGIFDSKKSLCFLFMN